VESYRAAVAHLARTLGGSNVEAAARKAPRSFADTVPDFAEDRRLCGRLAFDRARLWRSGNPEATGVIRKNRSHSQIGVTRRTMCIRDAAHRVSDQRAPRKILRADGAMPVSQSG
jgi:hypothetical protein